MPKLKVKLFQLGCLVVAVAMALTVQVPVAHSDHQQLGGTFKGSGPISYTNPCNNLAVSGTVNATGTVTVLGEENGKSQVFVSVIYDAPNQSDGTNTYNAHGQATAIYSTLAAGGYYNLPMNIDYDSTNNKSLSFLAGTDAFVNVDTNQKPTSVPDVGRTGVCGK
jgi:hypothetical protein